MSQVSFKSLIVFFHLSLLHSHDLGAQTFTFDEEPVIGNAAARIALPEKQGTLLSLGGKTGISGNMGELKYTYPIKLPAWRSLFESLQLSYSSTASFGIWGQGFSDNIPYIERSTQFGVPIESSPFRSSQSGELSAWTNGNYRARIEGSYARFDFKDNIWIVQDGRGGRFIYGEDESAREGELFVSRWWLNRIEDPAGNSVRFYYQKDSNNQMAYIQSIAFVERDQKVSYAFGFRYEGLTTPWTSFLSGNTRTLDKRVAAFTAYWIEQKLTAEDLRNPNWERPANGRMFELRFSYSEAGPSRRSLLQKIERFGLADTDTMPATELSYSQICLDPTSTCRSAASFQADVVLSGKPPLNPSSARLLDVNSDGILDILGHNQGPGTSGVWFNSGADSSDSWRQFSSKYPLPLQNVSFDLKDRLFMDINGDRLVDMVFASKAYINLGGAVPLWNAPGIPITGLEGTPPPNDLTKGAWIDINGDSRTDFIQYLAGSDGASMSLKVFTNDSSEKSIRFLPAQIISLQPAQPLPNRKLDWTDINGDGLPDLLMFVPAPETATNQIQYWLNQGQNRFAARKSASIVNYREQKSPRWFDVNADGYVDALIAVQGSGIKIFLNNGRDSFEQATTAFATAPLDTAGIFEFGDVNGNGSRDLIVGFGGNRMAIYDPYGDEEIKAPYILREVKTSLGSIDSYFYRSSTIGLAEQPLAGRLPITMQVPRRWLQTAMRFNAQGAYTRQVSGDRDYLYQKGFYDTKRNEFLGFAEVKEWVYHDADETLQQAARGRGQITETVYYTTEGDGLLRGRIKSQRTLSISSGEMQSSIQNDYGVYQLFENSAIFLPVLKTSQSRKYEGTDYTEVNQKYCTNLYMPQGLPSRVVKTETLDGKDYRVTETQFLEPSDRWLVRFPKIMKLYEPSKNLVYLGKAFEYHPDLCRITQISRLIAADTWQLMQTAEYDESGNLASYSDADSSYSRLQYAGPGGFLPTSVETSAGPNAPMLRKQASYNYRAGTQLETYTDENGKRSRLEYDGLGRLLRWYTPLSGEKPAYSVEYSWGSVSSPSKIRSIQFGRSAGETQYLDSLLYPAALVVPSDSGFILKRLAVQGPAGQTLLKSNPRPLSGEDLADISVDMAYASRFDYDEKLRQKLVDNPAFQGKRAVTSFSYSWNSGGFVTTRINPEKDPRRTVHDVFGRTIASSEINSSQGAETEATIRADYDIANRLVMLHPVDGQQRRYLYNQAGQLYEISSDDNGVHRFEYTTGDLLKAKLSTGVNQQAAGSIYYTYDWLKREVEVRQLPKQALEFDKGWGQAKLLYSKAYDASVTDNPDQQNLLGRMSLLKLYPGAYYEYSYDDDGNRNREEVQLYDKRFKTEYGFSPTGQMLSIRYPDDELVSYEYSPQSGLLSKVSGIVNAIQRDRLGRPLRLDLTGNFGGDKLEMTHAYDESTGLVTEFSVQALNPILLSRYENYDLAGRLLKVSGLDSVLTEHDQSYTYDKRGQLISAAFQFSEAGKETRSGELLFSYENSGDILQFENGRFGYSRNDKGLLTSIVQGTDRWTFDDLARLQSAPTIQKVGWYNQSTPACFLNAEVSYRYAYFPDGTRFTEVRTDSQGTLSTAFLNQHVSYTKETDTLRKYYFMDGLRIAVAENNVKSLLVEDLLHTGRLRRASSGEITYYAFHKPYGQKFIDQQAASVSQHKYQFAGGMADSGLEIQQFGSRFYDPRLGRFIQADMVVLENPTLCLKDSVSCQLHAYARNNPIFMADPHGELPVPAMIIVGSAIGGGVVGGVSSLINDYIDSGTISQAALVRAGVSTVSGAVKGGLGGFMLVGGAAAPVRATIAIGALVNTMESTVNENLSAKEAQRPASLANIVKNTLLATGTDALGARFLPGTEGVYRAVVKEFGNGLAVGEKIIGLGSRITPGLVKDAGYSAGIEAGKTALVKAADALVSGPDSTRGSSSAAGEGKDGSAQSATPDSSTATPEGAPSGGSMDMPAESVIGVRTESGAAIPSSDACASCFEDAPQ